MTNAQIFRIKELSNNRKKKVTFDLLEDKRNGKRAYEHTARTFVNRLTDEFASVYARVKSTYDHLVHRCYRCK